jgi:poly-gamma-glutamate synthesis protein (capsule biosynthesis protein)
VNPSESSAWRDAHVPSGFTVALVGDLIINQSIAPRLRRESPELLAVLQNADFVVGNYEGSIIELEEFAGYPAALSGFSWLISPSEVVDDLVEVGFHAFSRANNHATDWGHDGMRSTDRYLRDGGFAIAGTGECLAAARAAGVHQGDVVRSSLVSFATTFEADTPAADPSGQVPGRPGAHTIGVTPVVLVDEGQLAELRSIRDAQAPHLRAPVLLQVDDALGVVTLMGTHFAARPSGVEGPVDVEYKVDQTDAAGTFLAIRQAKQTSDFTVVAGHTHEPNNWATEAPRFQRQLARDAVANGADIFVGHGPHQLRGIEVIDGRAVFYSLGNFCFMDNAMSILTPGEWDRRLWNLAPGRDQLDPRTTTPAEFMEWRRQVGPFSDPETYESVVAVVHCNPDGTARRIELHPIELHLEGRDQERGVPRTATPDTAQRILMRLADLSAPLGTAIVIDADRMIGVIDLGEKAL